MCNETPRSDDQDGVSETNPSHDPLRALLEAAVSPASRAELGDVETAVAAFRSELAGPASGTVQGSRVAFLRRVPRRAVGVVVGTLLVAGTAAAAATDTLPSWVPVVGGGDSEETVALDDTVETDSTDDSDDADTVAPSEDTTPIDGTGTPSVVSVPEQSSRDWGWCTAWSKGLGDETADDSGDVSGPAEVATTDGGEIDELTVAERLAVLAGAEGLSVEEFCSTVLASPPNDKNPGKGPGTTVEPTGTEPESTVPNGNGNGNGNGSENGNGGKGGAGNGSGDATSTGNGKGSATTAP